jgi:NTE family protein
MKTLRELAGLLLLRLPAAFTLPFLSISLWWVLSGFKLLDDAVPEPAAMWAAALLQAHLPASLAASLAAFIHAVLVIALFALGFLAAYNASAGTNALLVALRLKPPTYAAGPPQIPHPASAKKDPLANVHRIGLVLAGGGAKGAFQAGAMTAIYRFLAEHDALRKVKVIAGTSIGSWNALFWLADLIKPEGDWDGQGIHERWWRNISVKSLTAPSWYLPALKNSFLSYLPWRQVFDRLFGREDVRKRLLRSDIHFYLTRSNVRSGELECATNNPAPPTIGRVTYEYLDPGDPVRYLAGLKEAVFASMDLPPLFPYAKRDGQLYEDGGVIDNVPITFAAGSEESCDLIFVLPLSSDFREQDPNTTSILMRMLRIIDVRQGALERGSFKMLYLYNELAALREHVRSAGSASAPPHRSGLLDDALRRKHQVAGVFAVCPLKSFARETIGARELWKRRQAGIAFEVMRDATAGLLPGFRFKPQDRVRVALVGRDGSVTWDENF